jgi:hypothetical protein
VTSRARFGWVTGRRATGTALLALLALLAAGTSGGEAMASPATPPGTTSNYIVSPSSGTAASLVQSVVLGVGGAVQRVLDDSGAVEAALTSTEVGLLQATPAITVTPDATVELSSTTTSAEAPPQRSSPSKAARPASGHRATPAPG